jgi:hypothetical protein
MGVCSVGSLLPTIPVGSFVVPDDWYCPFDVRRVGEGMEAHFLPVLDEDLREVILNGCSDAGVQTVVSGLVTPYEDGANGCGCRGPAPMSTPRALGSRPERRSGRLRRSARLWA